MTISHQTGLQVLAVPAFNDNYLWLIHDGVHAAVVDPGDAAPVLAALAAHHLTLTAILLTHHHADHIGGVPALLAQAGGATGVPVFGPHDARIPAVTRRLADGDTLDVPGIGLGLRVLDVPGHTIGHIAYVSEVDGATSPGEPWLFCGDTLFAAGCGRLFEGTPAQMRTSLDRLAALPPGTRVYCAHEYTLANLRFALAAEPGNARLRQRFEDDSATRAAGLPTLPSTIALELATNPFLRYAEPAIVARLGELGKLAAGGDDNAAFAALRSWKNDF